jgi:4'-phosphopantetheinyl transferase
MSNQHQCHLLRRRGKSLNCPHGEVHVWRIGLDVPATELEVLGEALSYAERQKANRFQSAQLRDRWTVARGALRWILSAYVKSKASSLEFRTTRFGKPYLGLPSMSIAFNLSHTGSLAFLAISAQGRVGIDAEVVSPIVDVEGIARRFFAPSETEEILRLPLEAHRAAFFACWSRKEAFVKAIGKGLHVPLDSFRVNVRPDEPPRLLSLIWHESSAWGLADIAEPGIAATLAIDQPSPQIRRFEFSIRSYMN